MPHESSFSGPVGWSSTRIDDHQHGRRVMGAVGHGDGIAQRPVDPGETPPEGYRQGLPGGLVIAVAWWCGQQARDRELLGTRRAEVSPEQIGLGGLSRRRAPGLRHKEIAPLAGSRQRADRARAHRRARLADAGALDVLASWTWPDLCVPRPSSNPAELQRTTEGNNHGEATEAAVDQRISRLVHR